MHYKGEGVSPSYIAWAVLLAENNHWQLCKTWKKDLSPRYWKHSQSCLSWANRHCFSALFPAGAGLLTSRLSLLQGSQPLKCFICKLLSSPQHRKAPQMLLIGTAGTDNIACPRCLPTHLLQLCSQMFWGISEICTLRIRLLSCLTQKSSWNVAASCLNSFSEVRFSSFHAKAAYNKEEKTAKFRKALF